ncbi:MAG: hypothetical protein ACPL1G_03425 [Thermodesulfovibrionales bacterium]
MISVILYGRNDSYGYNLHKRAAISLNCIAEVLTHPGDEIIFVDCNTPDDMPTFPEAIRDTLTQKAKNLLRILRLRPHLYEKYKKGSPLKALEPLSRNIAIRRSNPSNRWILSTNTDMVFVVRDPLKSLSDVVAELPDGFYELPRFEVPEGLWESVNRLDPVSIISDFRKWGQKLHLNEVIISRPDILFDGPGDFQLFLREQIFKIHGFNEDMVWGWHVDSNLCKRLYILNGETKSLLDHVFAYHCDHTRQSTPMHQSKNRTENDLNRFYHNVISPFLHNQAEKWGLPHEEIEEIRLTDYYEKRFINVLEDYLPGMLKDFTTDFYVQESFDHGQIYDTKHVIPFIIDHLFNFSNTTCLGYFGCNDELLSLMDAILQRLEHRGLIYVSNELIKSVTSKLHQLSSRCFIINNEEIINKSDIFIFDTSSMHIPQVLKFDGISFPENSFEYIDFKKKLQTLFLKCIKVEGERYKEKKLLRRFLIISSVNTWFESLTLSLLDTTLTPYSSRIRYGYIHIESDISTSRKLDNRELEKEKNIVSFAQTLPDKFWEETVSFVKKFIKSNERLIGPEEVISVFKEKSYSYLESFLEKIDIQWAIIHKGMLSEINFDLLNHMIKTMRPVFTNEVFIILTNRTDIPEISRQSENYKNLLERVYMEFY